MIELKVSKTTFMTVLRFAGEQWVMKRSEIHPSEFILLDVISQNRIENEIQQSLLSYGRLHNY